MKKSKKIKNVTLYLIKKLHGAWPLALRFRNDNFMDGPVQLIKCYAAEKNKI